MDCDELRKQERHIKYLKIRDSDIPTLEDHIFVGMKIEHLVIYNSKLKSLGANSVSSQTNVLSHLVLSKNFLEEVPSRALKRLHKIVKGTCITVYIHKYPVMPDCTVNRHQAVVLQRKTVRWRTVLATKERCYLQISAQGIDP